MVYFFRRSNPYNIKEPSLRFDPLPLELFHKGVALLFVQTPILSYQ